MLKYAALLFNTIALLIYQLFFADGITVTQKMPSTAKADSEFIVELTINRGTNEGFAKLQQELPEGLTAVQDENNGASFFFTNQSVNLIWTSLPTEKEFKVKYKVKVASGQSGDKIIGGKISYISDNVKQSIEIPPSTVNIADGKLQAIVPTTPTNTSTLPNSSSTQPVNSSETVTTNNSSSEPTTITFVRTVSSNISGNFTVEISVTNSNYKGFAKLLETLPIGFTASPIETEGGYFSFDNQKVKIIWISMPSKTEFKISYNVAVSSTLKGNQSIEGVFSYLENDEIKKIVIPTKNITPSEPSIATNTRNTENKATNSNTSSTNKTAENSGSIINNTSVGNTDNEISNTAKSLAATTIPSPQEKVYYRTQIAALKNSISASIIANKYKITSQIVTEMADGFTKYTTGNFNDYKSARDGREEIKNKGVIDPFITAYSGEKRITVQEALMITSQKWFR